MRVSVNSPTVVVLFGLLLTSCGNGDAREQLRDACDDLAAMARDRPDHDAASALEEVKTAVNGIAEDSQDSGNDTHELAMSLWLAIDDGGSVAQVMARGASTCTQIYADVEER